MTDHINNLDACEIMFESLFDKLLTAGYDRKSLVEALIILNLKKVTDEHELQELTDLIRGGLVAEQGAEEAKQ